MFSKKSKKHSNGKKRSFFEKLTGVVNEGSDMEEEETPSRGDFTVSELARESDGYGEETSEGQLSVDIYQTDTTIYIQALPAGVSAEDLNISITPETVTISGKRDGPQVVTPENYLVRELYWGSFSRTITLPEEVDPDESDAVEKHGLLIIRLPKVDKEKKHKLKVKSL